MVEARQHDGVWYLDLPSPVLALDLLRRLVEALAAAAATPQPLVLTSRHPRVFLAGADLSEIAGLSWRDAAAYAAAGRAVAAALRRHPAPTVAAVHGPCLGGGVDLVLACDGIVAAPAAFFRHPGAARGLLTGWGGSVSWPAAGGRHTAAALLDGREVTAPQAHREGWVARLSAEPVAAAAALACAWSALAPSRLAQWRCFRDGDFVDRFRACVIHRGEPVRRSARESS